MIGTVSPPFPNFAAAALGERGTLLDSLQSAVETMMGSGLVICGLLLIICAVSWGLAVAIALRNRRAQRAVALFLEEFRAHPEPLAIYRQPAPTSVPPATTIYQSGCHALANLISNGAADEAVVEARLRGAPHLAPTQLNSVEAAIQRTTRVEAIKLDRYLPLLGSIAASTPFLGLLGAAWCLMESRAHQLNTVAFDDTPSALLCLILGLLVSIPALIAYRLLEAGRQRVTMEMENFASEFSEAVANTYIDHGQRYRALPSLTSLDPESTAVEINSAPPLFGKGGKVIDFSSPAAPAKETPPASPPPTILKADPPTPEPSHHDPSPGMGATLGMGVPDSQSAPMPSPPSPEAKSLTSSEQLPPQPTLRPTAAATLAALSESVSSLGKDIPPKAPPKIASVQKPPADDDSIPVFNLTPSGKLDREGVA